MIAESNGRSGSGVRRRSLRLPGPVALVPLVPLALAILAALLLGSGLLPDPILSVRADLATLLILLGGGATALLAIALVVWRRGERDGHRAGTAAATLTAAADRRRFLRRLDHELKNPLTAIHAGAANLSATATGDEQTRTVGSIMAQTVRLSRLASDLRKLADLETRPLEWTPVDLADLLDEVVATAREGGAAAERQLTLTLPQVPWPLPPVAGDRDLLFLALYNLLDNAQKFTRPGDTIEVRAYEDGATVAIEVADTGPGLPEAEVAFVWEELYRSEAARGVPGSGLGLALVRAVVARHGGQASLRSRAGRGTVTTVRLPVG